ncbi:polysaccharide biosynthesis/export family protein [Microvirga sp. 0TCS3.31]
MSSLLAAIRLGLLLVLATVPLNPSLGQNLAPYSLRNGDVLEMAVVGVPALTRRATIGDDGKLHVPVLGQVDANGRSLSELQQQLETLLVEKNVVKRPSVSLSIVEHRPVYITGDVSKPGEYRYRPGMTIRNAVALAGGYDLLRLETRGAPSELLEARGQAAAAAIELVRFTARAARIRAQIANQKKLTPNADVGSDLDPALLASIWANEGRQLEADLKGEAMSQAHLERMIKLGQEQVATLEQAERQSEASLQQQEADAARSRELLQRSVGTVSRAEETQRALTQVRVQLADARARSTEARKELNEHARNLEAFDEQRTSKLISALQEAEIEAGKARARSESERSRVELAELGRTKRSEVGVTATVYRQAEGSTEKQDAALDTVLRPGDGVEITAVKTGALADTPSDKEPSRSASGQ